MSAVQCQGKAASSAGECRLFGRKLVAAMVASTYRLGSRNSPSARRRPFCQEAAGPFGRTGWKGDTRDFTVGGAWVACALGKGAMRLRTILCSFSIAGVLAASSVSASVPPSPDMQASQNAINSLWGAAGEWFDDTGGEHTLARQVLVGPGDVLYLNAGPQRQGVRFEDVITFDVKSKRLLVFLPGYRAIGNGGQSAQLVPMLHTGDIMFQWSEAGYPCNLYTDHGDTSKRTTVRVVKDDWFETEECLDHNGVVFSTLDRHFKRSGPQEPFFRN